MLEVWYEILGYDRKSGRPRPETLRALDLPHLIPALWDEDESDRDRSPSVGEKQS
jgi:hypothetical protein